MTRPESVPQTIWDTLTPEAQACFADAMASLCSLSYSDHWDLYWASPN